MVALGPHNPLRVALHFYTTVPPTHTGDYNFGIKAAQSWSVGCDAPIEMQHFHLCAF